MDSHSLHFVISLKPCHFVCFIFRSWLVFINFLPEFPVALFSCITCYSHILVLNLSVIESTENHLPLFLGGLCWSWSGCGLVALQAARQLPSPGFSLLRSWVWAQIFFFPPSYVLVLLTCGLMELPKKGHAVDKFSVLVCPKTLMLSFIGRVVYVWDSKLKITFLQNFEDIAPSPSGL